MSATQFRQLFEGRLDARGAVWGESIDPDHKWHPFNEDDWTDLWWDHLHDDHQDSAALGIYPMIEHEHLAETWTARLGQDVPKYFVKWGCSDIDDGYEASLPLARNMQKAAELLSLDLWVERTKGKGYHCWLFAEEWVPAEVMRRALLALHQVAGVRPTEVNPKQLDLSSLKRGLGNYVNLPYAASAPEGKRVMIHLNTLSDGVDCDGQTVVPLDMFLEAVRPAPFEQLWEVASLYKPPPPKQHVQIDEPSTEAKVLARHLGGLAFKIWKEGPLEGRDRSTTLARLAHLIAEGDSEDKKKRALTAGEGLVLLRDADKRWGKFYDRADGEEQLCMMIEAAEWSA